VSSLFLTRVEVYVGVCVCKSARTHTAHGMLDGSQGVGTRHLGVPKNLDGINLSKCVFVCVYKVHM